MLAYFELYTEDILHLVSQALLVPTILILIFLIGYALWCIGSVLVERFTERKHLAVKIPELLDKLNAAPVSQFGQIIDESGLLRRQKNALHELIAHPQLPEDTIVALAKRLIADEEIHYRKIVARTELATKIGPMFGLMGTLIPLGPGIVAMGQGDTATLSASLLIAFDTTVAGLITAIVTFSVSKLRRRWYDDYMVTIESVMTCILQKITVENGSYTAPAPHSVTNIAETPEVQELPNATESDVTEPDAVEEGVVVPVDEANVAVEGA